MKHPSVKSRLFRFVIAVIAIVLCAGAAMFIPPLWKGVSGRDFRPSATTMALLVFLLAAVFRWRFWWDVWDFLWAALGVEFLTLLIISHFSGFTWLELFHWFNLNWLLGMSIFTIAPWLLGFGLGSLHRWCVRRVRSTDAQPSASPNGGPAAQPGISGVTEGPPSVS
jgi:hypothetical protein